MLVLGSPRAASAALQEVREVHYQMGTFLDITLWHTEPDQAHRLIRASVQEVHRLEEILSDYIPDSGLSQFNATSGKGKFRLPAELFDLLQISSRLSAKTGGYFDVTIGPLMELWRDAASVGRPPDRQTLEAVLGRVGYEKLALFDGRQAELLVLGMKIDLGGIGKGYAVDRIAERLKAAGIKSALINFGGSSMLAVGAPPGEPGWEIGVQGTDGRLGGVLYLRGIALSTSGSMGKFWTIGGKQYGHLIDPKSGLPVRVARMATAVAPSATVAEALTKPLVLRGAAALPVIARFSDTEAVVTTATGPASFSRGFKTKTRWKAFPGA
jgi:thiamine biosynthesis lipoprotein